MTQGAMIMAEKRRAAEQAAARRRRVVEGFKQWGLFGVGALALGGSLVASGIVALDSGVSDEVQAETQTHAERLDQARAARRSAWQETVRSSTGVDPQKIASDEQVILDVLHAYADGEAGLAGFDESMQAWHKRHLSTMFKPKPAESSADLIGIEQDRRQYVVTARFAPENTPAENGVWVVMTFDMDDTGVYSKVSGHGVSGTPLR